MDKINLIKPYRSQIIMITILLISAIAHGYNMLGFPYFENDEGTYMSQAWSILTQGSLSPYTYWYDHPPLGWFFIAIWTLITGGFSTFGLAVDSGRILMLLIHVASTGFLYSISRSLTSRTWPAVTTALIFTLSPIAIYFQRRVLLDNLMVFWLLSSLWLIIVPKFRLHWAFLSSLTFGLAVLTKENALFFLPAIIYQIYSVTRSAHRRFALSTWVIASFSLISTYFLYALLKSEFWPASTTGTPHVSLITSIQEQMSRGQAIYFFNQFTRWWQRDAALIIMAIGVTFFNLWAALKNKIFRFPILLLLGFWFFLLRGKLIIDFYIIPLIPFIALNIGIFINWLTQRLTFRPVYHFTNGLIACGMTFIFLNNQIGLYTVNETLPQRQALQWMFKKIPPQSTIATDNFAFVDIKERGYHRAEWFSKIWFDPAVHTRVPSWQDIDYLLLSHEVLTQVGTSEREADPIKIAYQRADQKAFFGPVDPGTYLNLNQFKSTNGDWAAIYQLPEPAFLIMEDSWAQYKNDYIHSYGQVIDPATNTTTSEGQSYALLRAVWMNDRSTFDGVWQWTQDHLQYRENDKLFSWQWGTRDGKQQVLEWATASDADQDIALALIFAYYQWSDPLYLSSAQQIIEDIWKHEVVTFNSRYVLTSTVAENYQHRYLVNPSYLSPAWYRIFALHDSRHPWEQLAEDSYWLLQEINKHPDNIINLPPNWISIRPVSGNWEIFPKYVNDSAHLYGYDAFRTYWRVALDAQWFDTLAARHYLQQAAPFYRGQLHYQRPFYASYQLNGQPAADYVDISTLTGPLAIFSVADPDLAQQLYQSQIYSQYHWETAIWGSPNNYYNQNWSWFTTALVNGQLPNLSNSTITPEV